jgi:hypothetical protein
MLSFSPLLSLSILKGIFQGYFNSSIARAVSSIYPGNTPSFSLHSMCLSAVTEYTWYCWMFASCPRSFWSSIENQRQFLDWFAEQNEITQQSDWYSVKWSTVSRAGTLHHLLLEFHNMHQRRFKTSSKIW